jgi:hypothetical protein
MQKKTAIDCIKAGLEKAEAKHPQFPTDPIHAAAIVVEEAGELQQAALQYVYEKGRGEDLIEEAIHVGAMALRFLINANDFKKRKT